MPQELRVLQSLWAMEDLKQDDFATSVESLVGVIRDAGFDGAGVRFIDADFATKVASQLRSHGLIWQAQCYPRSVEDLRPVLELVSRLGADHVNVQPDVRPEGLSECVRLLEGWRRLGEQANVPLHFETHRDRMTNDLPLTTQLLECFPDLKLTADLSHYVVAREVALPVDEVNNSLIHRILDSTWGMHGRVASPEQVQVSLTYPQHQCWVDQFMIWWEYGLRSWKRRAGPNATFTFLCEIGPPPYAITGPNGAELSDRWREAIMMKDMIRALWKRVSEEGES